MGECAAGRTCRDSVIVNGIREPAAIGADRGLCPVCIRALRQAIRELQNDYLRLADAAGERPVTGETSVRMTPQRSMPINAGVLALQDELAFCAELALVLVVANISVARQKLRGYPVRNWPVIEAASRILPHSVDELLGAPIRLMQTPCRTIESDGIAVAVAMMRAHGKVNGVLGQVNPRRRLAMPCPIFDCGMPTLGINNGETDVTCTSCGGRWSEAEYDWFAGMITGSASEKEVNVLRWLLAEKTDELRKAQTAMVALLVAASAASEKLTRITKLASMPSDDLKGYDAATFAALLLEILEEE